MISTKSAYIKVPDWLWSCCLDSEIIFLFASEVSLILKSFGSFKESNEVILLGIAIDNKLVFKKHIENLCRTAQYKPHALTRIRKYLTLDETILLGNTFRNSQFNYAPLIWIFCRKILYHKIEKIHHSLKVIHQSEASYENLLLESSSVFVRQRHLRFLVTEIHKSTKQINPEFMWPYFPYNNISNNLRKEPIPYLPSTHSTY